MSGRVSRDKGKRGELQIVAFIRDELGIVVNRQLKQYQQAQHGDIEQLVGGYCIEVKNCASASNIRAWWAQAWAAAEKRDALPCLAYKIGRGEWRFVIPEPEWIGNQWGRELAYSREYRRAGFFAYLRDRLN
ncbi:MAG: hypothetical protein JSR70_07650 [Proteobacteria bacterium]|nr:hypothetical protein [Pseudomonadota bacterium]